MLTKMRNENRETRKIEIEKEAKLLLANEADFKMNKRQTNCYKKNKILFENHGCTMVSTVFISSRVKMVLICKENPDHGYIVGQPKELCRKVKNQPTICLWCNWSIAHVDARKNTYNEELKAAAEIKNEFGKDEGRLIKEKEIFSGNLSVNDKFKYKIMLNVDKGHNRKRLCIENNCTTEAGYGFVDITIHCYIHKQKEEKRIVDNACVSCGIGACYVVDGQNMCEKHASSSGFLTRKRKYFDSFEKIDQIEIDYHVKKQYTNLAGITGENVEEYLTEIITKYLDKIAIVRRVGNISNSMFDLEIQFQDGAWRGVQVRTLSETLIGNPWFSLICKNKRKVIIVDEKKEKSIVPHGFYPKNTLFVGVDISHKYFAVQLSDYHEKTYYFGNATKFGPSSFCFDNEEDFLVCVKSVAHRAVNSETIMNPRSDTYEKEFKMINNLEKNCEFRQLNFKRNKTHYSSTDCFINSWNVQCKFSSNGRETFTYLTGTSKTLGKSRKGKDIRVPYHIDDNIDVLVISIQSKVNVEKYLHDFLIIPRHVLIALGVFSTNQKKGKTSITIPSPDYHLRDKHPLYMYWNAWDILSTVKGELPPVKKIIDFKELQNYEMKINEIIKSELKNELIILDEKLLEFKTGEKSDEIDELKNTKFIKSTKYLKHFSYYIKKSNDKYKLHKKEGRIYTNIIYFKDKFEAVEEGMRKVNDIK